MLETRIDAYKFPAHTRRVLKTGFTMSNLKRAIADGHAKLTGDPNNNIQPVSKEALIGAIKKCHHPIWADGKLSPPAALRI
jgi:hypothetical protein